MEEEAGSLWCGNKIDCFMQKKVFRFFVRSDIQFLAYSIELKCFVPHFFSVAVNQAVWLSNVQSYKI